MADLLHLPDHHACYNNDRSNKPMIEVIQVSRGGGGEIRTCTNEVVCIIEGKLRYKYLDYPKSDAQKHHVFFLPTGGNVSYTALMDCILIVMRLDKHIQLCENYQIEWLFGKSNGNHFASTKEMNMLGANHRMRYFFRGLLDCVQEGVRCKYYFDLKIKEFFHLLLTNYTKDEIRNFLHLIVTGDTFFSENVRRNWHKYRTVEELAGSMCMSAKQFSKKFKVVFGNTAYDWMKNAKAQSIRREITSGNKPFKQIAVEYEFSSISTFAKFCKKELGDTPLRIRKGENQ